MQVCLCFSRCAIQWLSSSPSHYLPGQFGVPELVEAFLDDVDALPQLCLSNDERWGKPYLVPMGWLGQEAVLCQLQAEIPGAVPCGGA